MNDDECDRLRSLLRLSKEPGIPDGGQDAGVLILLDGTPDDYQVFLCIRSDEMRRHPGEVCFPGGMRDADENLQETAIREAEENLESEVSRSLLESPWLNLRVLRQLRNRKDGRNPEFQDNQSRYWFWAGLYRTNTRTHWDEEVGLQRDDFILLGSLPSFRARFGVLIHPTVALLRRPFFPRLNVHEVKDTFWMPLERFLDNSLHMSFIVDNTYAVHSFSFEEAHTYGVTALMCIVTAMGVLQKMPTFDIAPLLPISRISTMTPAEVMAEVCEYAGQPYVRLSKL